MKHRGLVALVAAAAVAWPLTVRAQQPMLVIGYLSPGSPESDGFRLTAFRQGPGEMGYVEGQNVAIEYRGAEGQNDRLPALAAELVRRQVTVIAAGGPPPAFAAKAATSTIPIVFVLGIDPVQAGLVASLNRPGGNITGVVILSEELTAKRLDLLHELVPTAAVVAVRSIRPTPFPTPKRESSRMQHVLSGCSCMSCEPARRARSTPPSGRFPSSGLVRSSSPAVLFSPTSALKSSL
jgi:putative tryptophan/tyrosine transport system substrate-binding protein